MGMKMGKSVLVVDDEKCNREGLARALSDSYKTYQASNGREALEMLHINGDIKVVISDLTMPEVDGFELLENIRMNIKNVSVIIVTAVFPCDSAGEALQRGAFDCMLKPVNLEKLETTVRYAMESGRDLIEESSHYKGGLS